MVYTCAIIEKHTRIKDDPNITIKEKETEYLDSNYEDTLIVSVRMINARVKRVMIDTCNFISIFYFDAFQKLKLSTNDINPMTSSLAGFSSDYISPLKIMNLYIIFRDEPYS